MDDFTIISYPSSKEDSLLSLTGSRPRYMLPFGGKFRVVDFTIYNSFSSGAKMILIYSYEDNGLIEYTDKYKPDPEISRQEIKTVINEYSDINFCYNLVMESKSKYFMIYNGDNPSIIDFKDIIKKYKKRKVDSLLYQLKINNRASMAYKLLVTNKKTLLKMIKKIIREKRSSPNIFEMVINTIINKGVRKSTFNAFYWPINNVTEYYSLNREVIYNRELFDIIYRKNHIESRIGSKVLSERHAFIGENGKIVNSFLSDFCKIDGRVENSIVYPGVEIGTDSFIKDSIILPFVKIGAGSRIIRAIVDEKTDFPVEDDYLNIGNSCRVGTEEENIKNSDFPNALFSSITLIGKDSHVLDNANIGGACFVDSGLGEEFFNKKKYLYDGDSVL